MQALTPADVLALRGWGASFGTRVVLASVDLDLPAQGIDVLMGPVKGGKSTLLRSLAGLTQSNALFRTWGQALVLGEPIAQHRPALVQQHAAVLKATLRDALIFHARQQEERAPAAWNAFAQQLLELHGLANLAPRLDEPMLSLPLEQQRAANILSHAATAPPLLCIDEPTYGLPEGAARWLMDWLRVLGQRTRLFVVLHHQGQTRQLANRIVLLGGGRVLAHQDCARFFSPYNDNPWVQQFVRSGSLAIASPDARPEDLDPSVEAPPPLPAAALEAIAPFLRQAEEAAVAPPTLIPGLVPEPVPAPSSAGTPVTRQAEPTAKPQAVSRPASADAAADDPSAPGMAVAARRYAPLPPSSPHGVAIAASVGADVVPASRGPTGFHWIVAGRLAGCAEPGISSPMDYDLDLLRRVGITHLVTLTERDLDQQALASHGLTNIHLPIFDRETPSIPQTYMLLRRMQLLLDAGNVVAVHCKAGLGRTGTVLAAWLIREGGLSAASALERLRQINRSYVQTSMQEQFLHDFETDLLMRT